MKVPVAGSASSAQDHLSPPVAEPLRMQPGTRRFLQVVGPIVFLAGLGLFLSNFFTGFGARPGDEGFWEDAQAEQQAFTARAIGGILLFAVGSIMMRVGYLKPAAELAATETEVAVEHSSRHLGRGLGGGLREAGVLGAAAPREVVKLRCRACGKLDTEDARFCSHCGKAM